MPAIYPNKEFTGWNKANLDKKSKLLAKFIKKHREFIGHNELDNMCNRMFELFGIEEE